MGKERVFPINIQKFSNGQSLEKPDLLAVEEPLEIRLGYGPNGMREQKSLAITMRTPGHDLELVMGFLFSEGIVSSTEGILHIAHCTDTGKDTGENIVRVELSENNKIDWQSLQRHFYTSSSCGVCGKASIESLEKVCMAKVSSNLAVKAEIVHGLSDKMREAQNVFEYTGGLHAAALFDANGNLLYMREDIGRHNAVDKVIGAALFRKEVPLHNHIIMLSGRSCYELVQKAVMAGIPLVVAVGAPSSLAVQTAENFGITLLGFTRNNTFNAYSKPERIVP